MDAGFDPRYLLLARSKDVKDILLFMNLETEADKRHLKYERICDTLDMLSDEECWQRFRFRKEDLGRMAAALRLPEVMRSSNGTKWTSLEGLTLMLRRLNYPKRLSDLVPEFGRHVSDCGIIFNEMIYDISHRWGHLLEDLDQHWLSEDNLRRFAEAVYAKGCPLENCWGFIDGSLNANCKPSYFQRDLYNGKDRVHGLKYQALVTPNGLTANLYGPMEGRRHDSAVLRASNLLTKIQDFKQADESPLVIYADKAYPISTNIITPYRGLALSPEERLFNTQMNSGRIAVEWAFGKVGTNFSFIKFPVNQKVYLQPLAIYYQVATLLTNCHTCLYGSQTSKYFEMDPPALEEYLRL